ncbi:MAG TPA: chaperone NapD [Ignavibacteriaceae bacterium]|jgi:nitrate reductase NapAB chaperone NapD|nr:chaperone NapD [Ignavibacteriaceae bacterium]
MIIASMIVTTQTGMAEEVALQLKRIPNLTTHGVYKGDNIIVVMEAEKEEEMVNMSRYIMNEFEGILGTYPTFIANEDDIEETEEK